MLLLRCSLLVLLLASCFAAPEPRRHQEPSSINNGLEGQSGDVFAEEKISPSDGGEGTKRQRPVKYVRRKIRKPPQVGANGMSSQSGWGDEAEGGADYSKPAGTKSVGRNAGWGDEMKGGEDNSKPGGTKSVGRSAGWGDEMKGGADYSKPGGTKAVGRIEKNEAHLGPNYVDRWNKEERLGPLYRPRKGDSGRSYNEETECSMKVDMAVMMERARMQERIRLIERERWDREERQRPLYQTNWVRNEPMGAPYGPYYRTNMDISIPEQNEWVDIKDEIPTIPPFAGHEGRCLFC